jgi:hypothetical protein
VLVFLGDALREFPDGLYAPVDLAQIFPLLRADAVHVPGNGLLGDPVVQFLPWLLFNRDCLRSGRLPLWNPYNGGGTPHLANYQSAVFSPFSAPFYVLDVRLALVAAALLKLASLGLFTFLFLRRLAVDPVPALVGATAFGFSGFNVVWLAWPHTGAAAALPAAMYFTESAIQRGGIAPLAGVTASLTAGLLAGHPETFYFCLLLVAAYAAARLTVLWRRTRRIPAGRAASLVAAGLLAAGLAAVQLVPFFEYAAQAATSAERRAHNAAGMALPRAFWPFQFFPDTFGNPSTTFDRLAVLGTNYNEANGTYLGGLALTLAAFSLILLRRDPRVRFFAAAAAVWSVYAYDVGGLGAWLRQVPGMSLAFVNRSQPVGLFAAACGAALAVQHLWDSDPDAVAARRRAWGLALLGTLLLAAHYRGAIRLLRQHAAALGTTTEAVVGGVAGHMGFVVLRFAFGLTAACVLPVLRSMPARQLSGAALVAAVFLQTGFAARSYHPVTPDRLFYPATAAVRTLQEHVGGERLVILGPDTIPPDLNMVHRLAMPASYDAIWIARYDSLYRDLFGADTGSWRLAQAIDRLGLRLFGVEFVLPPHRLAVDRSSVPELLGPGRTSPAGEIVPDRAVSQTFRAALHGLAAVDVVLATYARPNRCTLEARLEDVGSGAVVASRTLQCSEIADNAVASVEFPPIPGTAGREFRFVLASHDAIPGSAVTAWTRSDATGLDGELRRGTDRLSGCLAFLPRYAGVAPFVPVTAVSGRTLHRDAGSLTRFFTVGRARVAATDAEAIRMLREPGFDPGQEVILAADTGLGPPLAVSGGAGGPARVARESPGEIEIELGRDSRGYLVLTMPFYPGWTATVDGKAAPIRRANYAFAAVELPARSRVVRLRYAPVSFRLGLAITLGSLCLGGLAVAMALRRPGRAGERPGGAAPR